MPVLHSPTVAPLRLVVSPIKRAAIKIEDFVSTSPPPHPLKPASLHASRPRSTPGQLLSPTRIAHDGYREKPFCTAIAGCYQRTLVLVVLSAARFRPASLSVLLRTAKQ